MYFSGRKIKGRKVDEYLRMQEKETKNAGIYEQHGTLLEK